jgi:HAD superfamily hydrolase (TIGR01490 family)
MESADSYSEMSPARIAVFDFDGTLISGQSGSLPFRYLLSRGYLSPVQAVRLSWWGIRYALHLPKRQEEPREIIFSAFAGHGPAEVRAIMDDFYDKVLVERLRPRGVEEVDRRLGDGCVTLLVSATFKDIAARAARDMHFDGYVATDMKRDQNGGYTGEVEGEVIAGLEKMHAVERWADAHIGHGKWVVAYAYGDHYSDCDLLVEAANPYAVSPGRTLKRTARRLDWPIVDWK